MKSVMISVVIPLYNKEKSISNTLESVLAQTYTDYEIVIINDGSTDNSVIACEEFINSLAPSQAHSIHIFSKSNGGVSSARNYGVVKSCGEYVAFLDGDDIWEPTFIEEAARLIEDYPNAAIYGLGLGKIIGGKRYPAPHFVPDGFRGIVSNLWEHHNTMLSWTSSSTICSRELALKTPANEHLTHGEDLDQWLRLMLQGEAVFYNKTLAFYVQDAENRAMNIVPPIAHHIVSIIDQYAEARLDNSQFRKSFDTQMIYFLYQYLFGPYKKEAQRLAEKLDYSQLKKSLHFRMKYPYLYRMYEQLKEVKSEKKGKREHFKQQ